MKEENEGRPMGQVIKIDEARIRDHLGEMVRGTVEETLNAMLEVVSRFFRTFFQATAASVGFSSA